MSTMNRLIVAKNEFQGDRLRILCVCSAGVLRSPTAAVILSQSPFNFNTRAAGIDATFALIPVDQVLLEWADKLVCMDAEQVIVLREMMAEFNVDKPIYNFGIPDNYNYMHPQLVDLIIAEANAIWRP